MEINGQPQLLLQRRGQSQIGGAAAVHHQAVTHGGGGAVQIDHHQARIGSLRSVVGQQAAGAHHLPFLPGRIGQQGRLEAAVEVAVEVAPRLGQGIGVADQGAQGQAGGVQPPGQPGPGIEQPGGVALIAVGSGHHKHLPLRTGLGPLSSGSVQARPQRLRPRCDCHQLPHLPTAPSLTQSQAK